MIVQVYAIYDRAVGVFNQPLFFRSRGEAIRSFSDACQDEKSGFAKHAMDYCFMFLGSYDDATGMMFSNDTGPERVLEAQEAVPRSNGSALV